MKKIIFILILFLSCYLIYNFTFNDKYDYLVIGDAISKGVNIYDTKVCGYSYYVRDYLMKKKKLKSFNDLFTDSDYRISDIIRMIKYNETKNVNGYEYNINKLIKEADIITISLGMNELYYKFNNDNVNIYNYMNDIVNEMDELLGLINRFEHKNVIVLGYYNVLDKIDEVNYINVKLKDIVSKRGYTYVGLDNLFSNNPNLLYKKDNFVPNNYGYLKISQIIVEKIENN